MITGTNVQYVVDAKKIAQHPTLAASVKSGDITIPQAKQGIVTSCGGLKDSQKQKLQKLQLLQLYSLNYIMRMNPLWTEGLAVKVKPISQNLSFCAVYR